MNLRRQSRRSWPLFRPSRKTSYKEPPRVSGIGIPGGPTALGSVLSGLGCYYLEDGCTFGKCDDEGKPGQSAKKSSRRSSGDRQAGRLKQASEVRRRRGGE